MVFFSAFMMWAYTWNEYAVKGAAKTSIWRPLWDRCVGSSPQRTLLTSLCSINFSAVVLLPSILFLMPFQWILSWKSGDLSNFSSTISAASPPRIPPVDQILQLSTVTRGWILAKHLVLPVASIQETRSRPTATLQLFVRATVMMKRSISLLTHTPVHAALRVQAQLSLSFLWTPVGQ